MRYWMAATAVLLASTLAAQEKRPPKEEELPEHLDRQTHERLAREAQIAKEHMERVLQERGYLADPARQELLGRIGHLKHALRAAKEAGRKDEARKLAGELERLQGMLKVLKGRPRPGQPGAPLAQRRDEPRPDRRPEFEVLVDKIGGLRKEAFHAKLRGDLERSKSLWAQADELQARLLQQLIAARPRVMPRQDKRPEADLRREVEQLRRDVEELKRLLRERGPRRDR